MGVDRVTPFEILEMLDWGNVYGRTDRPTDAVDYYNTLPLALVGYKMKGLKPFEFK